MGWLVASLKRLRADRSAAAGLIALVLVTALLFGIAPRLLDVVADDVLRDEVSAAGVVQRNVQLIEESRLPAGETGDPMAAVAERGEQLDARLPPALNALVAERGWQVESARHAVLQEGDPVFLRLRFQEGIDAHVRYVEGRPPGATTRELDDVTVEMEEIDDIVVFEASLSRRTAEVFRLEAGETAVLRTDPNDPLVGPRAEPRFAAIDVVGIYEALDPDSDWWLNDPQLREPVVRSLGGDVRFYDAAALLADGVYPAFLASTQAEHPPIRYTWRRFVDPGRLDASRVEPLLVELRRAQTVYPTANPTPAYETGYRTGLLPLIEGQRARWAAATAILTVVALGPAAVAAAAVALVAMLAAQRRRAALAVSRSRGASLAQLVGAALIEALLLTVPATLIAAALAFVAIPGGPAMPTFLVAAAVAAVTALIVVATSVPATSAEAAAGGRDTGIVRPPGARRLVGEALLVALALGGAWLLRERGIRGASAAGTLESADPLIAAVPALAGLAAGVLVVRLFPLPMRGLAWLARARRGLVPVLAMRRATSAIGVGPILVVLLATSTIGAFASAALVHLERGTEAVAWREVGAAYRLTVPSGPLPGTLDPAALPGVEASAAIFRTAAPVGLSGPRTEFLVADAAGLEAVTAGTPAAVNLPDAVRGPAPGGPIPAIVSASLGERADGVDPGETFELSVEGYTLEYEAIDVRTSFPGVAADNHFVVVSREHVSAAAPTARMSPTAMLLRAPDDRADELRAAALDVVAGGTLEARAERTAALRGSPVAEAVRAGIAAAALVAALYAALAVAAALALAGLARAVEVAHLRTLGLTRRQAFGLVVLEHGPTIAAAFAIGVGLGVALFTVLRPGLGLAALVGSSIEVPLSVEPAQLLLVLLAIVGIVVFGMAVGAALQRAAVPATAVRRGFE